MQKIKIALFSALACAMMVTPASAKKSKKGYPEFSWDTVQVALHLGKMDDDFTPEETAFVAQFPLVCLEKMHAMNKHDDAAKGAFVATKAIKEINPDCKVLFYWNSLIDFGRNYKGREHFTNSHPEWLLRDKDGKLALIRNVELVYDVTKEDMREWWLEKPLDAVDNHDMDGVFVDAIHQFYGRPDFQKIFEPEKLEAIGEGAATMMRRLGEELNKRDKIFVANNIHPTQDYGTDIVASSNAAMYEHFCFRPSESADSRARQIELLQLSAKQGRIMMVKCWPRHYFRNQSTMKGLTQEQIIEDTKEDIIFPLACFLAGAGEYSYFCYSWGWQHNTGWLVDYPEYHKPLGKPLGDAVRDGYVFTRKFKHADVWVDVEKREAKIDWK